MDRAIPFVWVHLDAHTVRGEGRTQLHGALLLAAVYRQWKSTAELEKAELEILAEQIEKASTMSRGVVLAGDFNLDMGKVNDPSYRCRTLLETFRATVSKAGLVYHATPTTWRSYGCFQDGSTEYEHRFSTIDHVYTSGVVADLELLEDTSMDHRPLLLTVSAGVRGSNSSELTTVKRRNFKRLGRQQLETALQAAVNWDEIYRIHDVNDALKYLTSAIVAALDVVAPMQNVTVRKGKALYLARDTQPDEEEGRGQGVQIPQAAEPLLRFGRKR
jgi:hypothetical protein